MLVLNVYPFPVLPASENVVRIARDAMLPPRNVFAGITLCGQIAAHDGILVISSVSAPLPILCHHKQLSRSATAAQAAIALHHPRYFQLCVFIESNLPGYRLAS